MPDPAALLTRRRLLQFAGAGSLGLSLGGLWRARAAAADAAPAANPPSYGLRVGALDRRAELRPARQGWCRSALPWSMDLTGVERFERQP